MLPERSVRRLAEIKSPPRHGHDPCLPVVVIPCSLCHTYLVYCQPRTWAATRRGFSLSVTPQSVGRRHPWHALGAYPRSCRPSPAGLLHPWRGIRAAVSSLPLASVPAGVANRKPRSGRRGMARLELRLGGETLRGHLHGVDVWPEIVATHHSAAGPLKP